MVVTQFQSYIENNIPGALYSANLRELIQEAHDGKRPTIVFDRSAASRLFQSEKSQPIVSRRNIEDFVNRVISCGANLVVILRGNVWKNKNSYIKKCKTQFKKRKNQVNVLKEKKFLKDDRGDRITLAIEQSLLNFCVSNTLSFISNNHYKAFTSIRLAHEEAAEVATLQNCLAVIGQDSNYVIYEGIKFYIPINSLNIKTLDCKIYDKKKILEHLALKSYQLPMFATLCGNDVIQIELLADFHKRLLSLNPDKFLAVADIVRMTTNNPYNHAETMVDLIGSSYIDQGLITQSLDMYLKFFKDAGCEIPKNKLEVFADEKKRSGEWSNTLHKIFTRKLYGHNLITGLLDSNLICSVTLLRPLRKKIYGILFPEDETVEECFWEEMKEDENENRTVVQVGGEKPQCEHPGLMQLWDNTTPNLKFIKWNLFVSSVSRTLNYSLLEFVPPKLLVLVLALHYMETETPLNFNQKIFNEEFEVETFLLVGLLVSSDSYDPSEEKNYNLSGKTILRVSYLCNNFIETCYTLNLLNEVCGLVISKTDSCVCNFFDGVMIRYVYSKMKKGAQAEEFFNGDVNKDLFIKLKDLIRVEE